jgi:DNA-binding MarR family transcriptional regulator
MIDPLSARPVAADDPDFGAFASDLVTLSKLIRVVFGVALLETQFHNGQDHLLMVLIPEAPLAVSKLAAELDVRPSTISVMVDRLADRDLVVRLTDARDSRKTLIALTAAGIAAQAQIRAVWAEVGRSLVPKQAEEAALLTGQIKNLSQMLRSRVLRLR